MGLASAFKRLAIAKKHERSPEERAFVRRLDFFLLTFGCLSQVIKFLDQTNISTAYVSGMKEDLELYGNELNYFTTYFNIGYCIMLIPSQIILTHIRPSIWLPSLEIAWGIITGLIATTHSAKQIYGLRFALGFLESSAWPGMMTLLMHWYTPSELGKRMGFFSSAASVGGMLSGALQIAILDNLHGKNGLAGWRWLFIINAVMTVFVGASGFFLVPDTPNQPNPWAKWFKEDYGRIAMERLRRHGKSKAKRITWVATKRASRLWLTYFIPVWWVASGLSVGGTGFFGVFLKSLKDGSGNPIWTVKQVNSLPIGGSAIQVVTLWFWCSLSDMVQSRWSIIAIQSIIGIVPAIIMTVWTNKSDQVPLSAAYASFFLAYTCQAGGNILMAWLADLLPQDPEARTLIVGISVTAIYAISSGIQILMWPASKAPYFAKGWPITIGMWTVLAIMIVTLRYLDVRYLLPDRVAFRESQGLDNVSSVSSPGSQTSDSPELVTNGEKNEDHIRTAKVV